MKVIISLEKRHFYAILALLIFATSVFLVNALTPGNAPNPGHTIQQVAPPNGCGNSQVLSWSSSGRWECVNATQEIEIPEPTPGPACVLCQTEEGIEGADNCGGDFPIYAGKFDSSDHGQDTYAPGCTGEITNQHRRAALCCRE